MFDYIHKFEILDSIIEFVAILVVYLFAWFKFTTNELLHDMSVFKDVFSIYKNPDIAISMFSPSSFPSAIFCTLAAFCGFFTDGFRRKDGLSMAMERAKTKFELACLNYFEDFSAMLTSNPNSISAHNNACHCTQNAMA